jgi:hypothetical protein
MAWLQDWKPEHFPKLLEELLAHDALAECQRVVQQHLLAARQPLALLPENGPKSGLASLTDFLADQVARLQKSG